MLLREIKSEPLKEEITLRIMGSLPEWFNPPEDIPKKARLHQSMLFFAVYSNEKPIAFAALKEHNAYTAEIFGIGVLREYHRQGAGHMLVNACAERCLAERSVLTVKTLDGSAFYPPYDATHAFYLRKGFVPLEVFREYWDEENPCLFLAKFLAEYENVYFDISSLADSQRHIGEIMKSLEKSVRAMPKRFIFGSDSFCCSQAEHIRFARRLKISPKEKCLLSSENAVRTFGLNMN